MTTALVLANSSLDRYMQEVTRHPVLKRDQELVLARRYRDEGDLAAAHELVVSNLRFVVKVAHEYKGYGLKLLDLIQEGNIGLMHAVKKFDPERGYRLISYAVWWIRAHIQQFVLKSWSLVKVGSGRVKRKLFFGLRSERAKLEQAMQQEGDAVDADAMTKGLATHLGVEESDITDMGVRLAARDFSLDTPLGDNSDVTHGDMLNSVADQEEIVARSEQRQLLAGAIAEVESSMNDKERYILENRLLADDPQTLSEVGTSFGVSRQRVQQLETRLLGKLRKALPAPA